MIATRSHFFRQLWFIEVLEVIDMMVLLLNSTFYNPSHMRQINGYLAAILIFSIWAVCGKAQAGFDIHPLNEFVTIRDSQLVRKVVRVPKFKDNVSTSITSWCSGVLIAPDVVATARHCAETSGLLKMVIVETGKQSRYAIRVVAQSYKEEPFQNMRDSNGEDVRLPITSRYFAGLVARDLLLLKLANPVREAELSDFWAPNKPKNSQKQGS